MLSRGCLEVLASIRYEGSGCTVLLITTGPHNLIHSEALDIAEHSDAPACASL